MTDEIDGGVIPLESHWMANHYQNADERFLGWLVIQLIQHRVAMSDLTREELEEFGSVVTRLEGALLTSYNSIHPGDKIEIVYLVRLGESTLGEKAEWHLHYHLIPRTVSMKQKCEGMDIWKAREKSVRPAPSRSEIETLLNLIRLSLNILGSFS